MKPITLRIMEALDTRMVLEKEHLSYLQNMQIGHMGETQSTVLLTALHCPHILLRDLYFEPRNAGPIQIDLLLLVGNTAFIYEVKNYSGVWRYGDEAYRQGSVERSNPTIQVTRTKNNFKSLLREMGYGHLNVEAVVMHIGRNFTLLDAPDNRNVILPTQIDDHLAKLNAYQYPLSNQMVELAKKLPGWTVTAQPFTKMIPEYSFETLKKGIRCETCGSLVQRYTQRRYLCSVCNHKGKNRDAVKSAIEEFKLLFPDRRVIGTAIAEWCEDSLSRTSCRDILIKVSAQT